MDSAEDLSSDLADEGAGTERVRKRRRRRRTVKVGPFTFRSLSSTQRRWTRRAGMIGGGLLGVLVVTLILLSWRVYTDMSEVREQIDDAQASLLQGNMPAAHGALQKAQDAASEASTITNSIVWSGPAHIPVIGAPLKTVGQMSSIVDLVAGRVLGDAFDAVSVLGRPEFRLADGGVNLPLLEKAAPAAIDAANAANEAKFVATKINRVTWLPPLNDVADDLQKKVNTLASMLKHLREGAQVLPSVLGKDGPRTYLLIYQTNAEARGTGGFVGGAGILRADHGSIKVDHIGTNVSLRGDFEPLDLGPDFAQMYGAYNSAGNWYNSNISPHFPYAAQIWQYLWQQKTGVHVDGVISVDPFALSRILEVTGPLRTPDGTVITSQNVVPITERTSYERFGDDVDGRKSFLTSIAETAADAVTSRSGNTFKAIRAMSISIGEGRTAAWSSHPEEQTIIASTPIGHTIPYNRSPYANFVVNNGGGNKLDYYLSRSISYTGGACDGATRETTVSVRLTNNVRVGTLPSYALGSRQGSRDPYANRSIITLYATSFARVNSVRINGNPIPFALTQELGHPAITAVIDIPPGIPVDVTYELTEPVAQGDPQVPVQPLVQPTNVSISLQSCS